MKEEEEEKKERKKERKPDKVDLFETVNLRICIDK